MLFAESLARKNTVSYTSLTEPQWRLLSRGRFTVTTTSLQYSKQKQDPGNGKGSERVCHTQKTLPSRTCTQVVSAQVTGQKMLSNNSGIAAANHGGCWTRITAMAHH